MSLKNNEEKLFDYLEGNLSEKERLELELHLRNCKECSSSIAQAKLGNEIFKSINLKNTDIDLTKSVLKSISPAPSESSTWNITEFITGIIFNPVLKLSFALLLSIFILSNFLAFKNWFQYSGSEAVTTASAPLLAKVIRKAENSPAQESCLYGKDSEVITSEKETATIQVRDIGTIFVSNSSRIKVFPQKIMLMNGSVFAEVKKQGINSKVLFESENNQISIIGTSFGFQNTASGVSVSLFEGKVELCNSSGQKLLLLEGNTASFNVKGISCKYITDEESAMFEKICGKKLPLPAPAAISNNSNNISPNTDIIASISESVNLSKHTDTAETSVLSNSSKQTSTKVSVDMRTPPETSSSVSSMTTTNQTSNSPDMLGILDDHQPTE
ncbi:MAG: zf-HC2 domain-containing protein [Candidatus Riflebacteria bacterium]|nr:zf-HC2 domain-containing protein [Candidatus Riflebacteria bacterium]